MSGLLNTLREAVRHSGTAAPLLVEQGRTTTGPDLIDLIVEKTAAYRRVGVGVGSMVGILAWPPAEFVSDLFSVIEVGAVAVPLDRDLGVWELERLITNIVGLSHLALPPDSPLARSVPLVTTGHRELRTGPCAVSDTTVAGTAQLTSGTTGHQRAALRPVAALLVEAANYRDALGLGPDRPLACPVPLHHAYGLGLAALAGPLSGTPVHILSAERPRVLLRELVEREISVFAGVPPMLRLMARSARARPPLPITYLSAGSALDARTAEEVGTRLGGDLGQVYGTTETGPICARVIGDWDRAQRTVGPPLPGVTVRLDPEGVGPDEPGRVAVRSASSMVGYLGEKADGSGFLLTGDLGRWVGDELSLVGRVSTCINVAGVKVSPETVEATLLTFPHVTSCLVSGIPDDIVGERIKATVTPADVDLTALRAFCSERLSPSWAPHVYEAVGHLATTGTGKVLRSQP